jgi:hypothetical protein
MKKIGMKRVGVNFHSSTQKLPLLFVKENYNQRRNKQLSNKRDEKCEADEQTDVEGAHEIGENECEKTPT